MENIYIIIIFINLIFLIFHEKIFKFLNLYDYPNSIKKHETKISCTGGLLFLVNFLIIFLFFLKHDPGFLLGIFESKRKVFGFIFSFISIFLIGLLDDKFNLKPITKTFYLLLVILLTILIDEKMLIQTLYFQNNYLFYINHFSILFVLLSLLTFMNAFNMFDGINLQASTYFCFLILVIAIHTNQVFFFSLILIPFFVILYFNGKNKIFLGNSGSLLLSYLIGYFLIKFHGVVPNLNVENILLLILIPLVDLIRVVFVRAISKKSMFVGDNNHIHHIFKKKYDLFFSVIIIQMLIIIPNVINFFYDKTKVLIFLSLIVYFCIYRFLIQK